MRKIVEVIDQLVQADENLSEFLIPLRDRICKEDQYVPPELSGPRWEEVWGILSRARPPGHSKFDKLRRIFADEQ